MNRKVYKQRMMEWEVENYSQPVLYVKCFYLMSLNYLKGKIRTADELLCKKPVEFIVNSRFKVSER